VSRPPDRPSFAHASEAELARILDFYEVRWAYEPDTFPIGWNLDGNVVESFAPDFYLPDLDLYIELTTLKQKLVRKKNRKLRRLRELYPDIRIKLFYARDFRMLMLKFGRMALIDELTGTTGQATPPRMAEAGPRAVADTARSPVAQPSAPGDPDEAVLTPRDPAAARGTPEPADAVQAARLDSATAGPGLRPTVRTAFDARGRRRGRRRRHPAASPGGQPAPTEQPGTG
jgi:hypothetical protein